MRLGIVFLIASVMFAQEAPAQPEKTPPPPPQVLRVFQVKNADVNRLAAIIDVFGARVRPDPALRVISVSGTQEQVKAIEDAIQRYDVPPPAQRNVELTFHLLQAMTAPGSEKLPVDLEAVVKQLKSTFAYQGYRLGDTLLVRSRDGDSFDASSTANFTGATPGAPNTTSQLRAQRVTIGVTDKVPMIRIDNLRVGVRLPYCSNSNQSPCSQWNFMDNGINTSVDIKEGQKVVIGKTAIGSDSAIVVVVTAKVVD